MFFPMLGARPFIVFFLNISKVVALVRFLMAAISGPLPGGVGALSQGAISCLAPLPKTV